MTAEAQLEDMIREFTPDIGAIARGALAKMTARFPGAVRLVYDNYNALAIGFGPTERASEAIFSIALFPRRVNLCFLQGGRLKNLKDPGKLLQGSGKLNRFIPLDSAATLDEPAVRRLLKQAADGAAVPLSSSAKGYLVIKSVSARQRPRRPGEKARTQKA